MRTEATKLMRANLKRINDKIAKERITLELSDDQFKELEKQIGSEEKPRSIDFTRIKLYRIFNNSSFEEGGRFYGGWWQQIPREYRKYITVSHKDSIELDYSGHHYRILYAREDLDPPSDPYDIDGLFEREHLKIASQIILNEKSKPLAMIAIGKKGISNPAEFVNAFEAKHMAIKKYFYTGEGVRLQYLDSMLAEQVMLRMLERRATVLPLHDSFIVLQSYREELEEIMEDEFKKMFNKSAIIKLKPTSMEEAHKKREEEYLKKKEEYLKNGKELPFYARYEISDDYAELGKFKNHERYREIWGY